MSPWWCPIGPYNVHCFRYDDGKGNIGLMREDGCCYFCGAPDPNKEVTTCRTG